MSYAPTDAEKLSHAGTPPRHRASAGWPTLLFFATVPVQVACHRTSATSPTTIEASSSAPAVSVESEARDAARPDAARLMRMQESVSHGYGCGGHCAFNWRGKSDVLITFAEGGVAKVSDSGWLDSRL